MSVIVMESEPKAYLTRLVRLRKLKGLSQGEVAAQLNIEYSTYGKIENGKIALTVDRALELARIFNVPIGDIISEGDVDYTHHVNEPELQFNKSPRNATIIINVGSEGTNSPKAEKFLEQLGRIFREENLDD